MAVLIFLDLEWNTTFYRNKSGAPASAPPRGGLGGGAGRDLPSRITSLPLKGSLWRTYEPFNELIEVAAMKVEQDTGAMLDSFHSYIHPRASRKLDSRTYRLLSRSPAPSPLSPGRAGIPGRPLPAFDTYIAGQNTHISSLRRSCVRTGGRWSTRTVPSADNRCCWDAGCAQRRRSM